MAVERPLLVLIGPTASGKSRAALDIARRVGGEILSVDSMQVYRGMDVGTAKPTPSEQAEVRHHLIDVVDPDEPFTVARFVELADEVIRQAGKKNVPLVVTGGTPLYYKALFEGLFGGPGADDAIRERLKATPGDELHRRLLAVDPTAAARIHANDTRRLVRALEVYELTGRSISSFQTDWAEPKRRHRAVWTGLTWDKDTLNRRINARVKAMMTAEWVDEVRALIERYGALSQTAAEATGYRELIEYIRVGSTIDDVIESIKIGTRQLARRQMKWFRRFAGVDWIQGDQPVDGIVERAISNWEKATDNTLSARPFPTGSPE